jgi:hypothetical protein
MDEGLFAKHIASLTKRTDAKQEIISTIYKQTGILLEESQLTLEKKKITLSISSVVRAQLVTKKAQDALSSLGYTISL